MAPKKAKKTADSINSRLALVMKSGKGMTEKHLEDEILCLTSFKCSHPRLQVYSQIFALRKSEVGHHRWQYSSSTKERTRVLFDAVKDKRSPLRGKQCRSYP